MNHQEKLKLAHAIHVDKQGWFEVKYYNEAWNTWVAYNQDGTPKKIWSWMVDKIRYSIHDEEIEENL